MILKNKKIELSKFKPLFLPLALVSLILLSFSYLIRPKAEEISSIIETIRNNQQKLVKLTEKISLLSSLNESDLTARSDLVMKALIEDKQPMVIMNLLKQYATESGIEIGRIDVKLGLANTSLEERKGGEIPSLAYSIKLSGSFDQLTNYIEKLTHTFPILRMEKISFQETSQPESQRALTTITSYYLPLPVSLGKIEAPVRLMTEKEKQICDRLRDFTSSTRAIEEILIPIEAGTGRSNPFL